MLFLLFCQCQTEKTSKKGDVAIDNLISQMTLDEKIDFIGGYNEFYIRGYKHLGIPEIKMADGPVGVRNYGASTAYPVSIALAASWNRKMAGNVGKAIALEARSKNVHMMLGPGMNIYRFPLCGRNFEYLGEDPYLAGQMASAYIKGMQGEGVIATAKHYVANNQEFNRHHVSSDIDERTLHEIYLPAFKTCVEEGNVATVMTSYNLINGIHASENNYLNNEILKGRWGFKGFVVSDWSSTYNGLACAKGGLDLEMPSATRMNKRALMPAIKNGELNEAVIDDKVRRILNVYKRFGFFEKPDLSRDFLLDTAFVKNVVLNAAREGIVLLKNEDKLLPLKKDGYKNIVVIGPNGNTAITGGGGSSMVEPSHKTTLYNAVKKLAGENTNITYQPGVYASFAVPENIFDHFDFYTYRNDKKEKGVHAVYYRGHEMEGDAIYETYYDKLDLKDSAFWNVKALPHDHFSARFTCYYCPKESGYYSIASRGDDGYRIKVDGKEVVSLWRAQPAKTRMSDVYMKAGQEYKVEVEYFQNVRGAEIKLGALKSTLPGAPEELTQMAVDAARKADLVILSVGFNYTKEAESYDRTFEMPYNQSELISKIAGVNKNIVVVLNAGGNVETKSWIDKVKALLMAWYPGQEGAQAEAEILLGLTNPSGKMPASFAKTLEEEPAYNSYFDDDKDLRVKYSEGIFIGYRAWDKSSQKPLFPFGYGLSYTDFTYSDLACDKDSYDRDDVVTVSLKVKNTGKVKGAEVVQLYVSDKQSTLPRPVKELKAFDKIELNPGEEKTVTFSLKKDAFACYNPQKHEWIVEPGKFQILVGSSSADIRLKKEIEKSTL